MGNSRYLKSERSARAFSAGYYSKPVDEIFTQNKAKVIHESMSPANVKLRESRDSELHPYTIPIQFYLDMTGSMGSVPHLMIKDGLPTLMSTLIQNGVPDAALLFGGIGDHEVDKYPLQIGQFESGDAELDMWLTRTYIEGGGGGNSGESYHLAWYFAANHVVTDAFQKRGKKGFVFTIGDEPCLKTLPVSAVKGIMAESAVGQSTYTREELLEQAQRQNHVYHIHLNHGSRIVDNAWKQMLGNNLIEINDHTIIPRVISDIILLKSKEEGMLTSTPASTGDETENSKVDILL